LQPISRVDSALDNLDDFLEYICINEQNDVISRSDYGRSARCHEFTGARDRTDNDFVRKARRRILDFTICENTFFSNYDLDHFRAIVVEQYDLFGRNQSGESNDLFGGFFARIHGHIDAGGLK